jgi:hypothetical protein
LCRCQEECALDPSSSSISKAMKLLGIFVSFALRGGCWTPRVASAWGRISGLADHDTSIVRASPEWKPWDRKIRVIGSPLKSAPRLALGLPVPNAGARFLDSPTACNIGGIRWLTRDVIVPLECPHNFTYPETSIM